MFRRAEAKDAAKLALVGAASFLETFANDHPGDDLVNFTTKYHSVDAWRVTLEDSDNAVWIAEEAVGSPIGYAVLTPASSDGTTADDVELKRIYVLSKWHGTGLGRALFDAVEAEARARGAARLALSVYKSNTKALRFYERNGFVIIGEAIFAEFDVAFSDHVMAKVLG